MVAVAAAAAVEEEEAAAVVVRIVSLFVFCYFHVAHLLFATLLLPGDVNLVKIIRVAYIILYPVGCSLSFKFKFISVLINPTSMVVVFGTNPQVFSQPSTSNVQHWHDLVSIVLIPDINTWYNL